MEGEEDMHLKLTAQEEQFILTMRRLGWLSRGDVRIKVENGRPILIMAGKAHTESADGFRV